MSIVSLMRTIVLVGLALPFWIGLFEVTAHNINVPQTTMIVVLCAMTLALYVPLRRWRDAWPLSALFAGVIAGGSLFFAQWLSRYD